MWNEVPTRERYIAQTNFVDDDLQEPHPEKFMKKTFWGYYKFLGRYLTTFIVATLNLM